MRFILAVISGELKVGNRRKKDIEADLFNEGYDKIATGKAAKVQPPSCDVDQLPNNILTDPSKGTNGRASIPLLHDLPTY